MKNKTFTPVPITEAVIKAQREIIQGYYNRICTRKCSKEDIIAWLEDDLQTIRMDNTVLDARIILEPSPITAEENKLLDIVCKNVLGFIEFNPIKDAVHAYAAQFKPSPVPSEGTITYDLLPEAVSAMFTQYDKKGKAISVISSHNLGGNK